MFDTLLRSIQHESKVVSRKVYMYNNFNSKIGIKVLFSLLQAYLSHAASYVKLLGIYSTRHLKVGRESISIACKINVNSPPPL